MIESETSSHLITVEELDLTSFENITKFANRILHSYTSIYGLVNNAGIFYNPPTLTEDNFDITYQTNYLGHFLLTLLLLPLLRRHPSGSRIVNIASEAHLQPYLFPQPEFHKPFDDSAENRFRAYQYSKFCLVLFSVRLQELIRVSPITVHCVDPGNTETNIFRNFPQLSNFFLYCLQKPLRILIVKTPREGAQTVLHALTTKYPTFYLSNLRDSDRINYRVFDPILADALWQLSRRYCQRYLTSTN